MHDSKSPITQTPLKELFGPFGTTNQIADLLEGQYPVDSLDITDLAKEWLNWMEMTEEEKATSDIPDKITPEQFSSAFKSVREKTMSSFSTLHYTLWKAVAEDKEMSEYYAIMMSLPFQYGFAHPRWTTEIDLMLEKTDGEQKIHLMRIIGIVEADFNQALKIKFTRQLMRNAEKTGMTPNQWGGRANRSAPDCASRKLLTLEYVRYMKRPLGIFFSDLSNCFDRMLPRLSSLVSMKKGMTSNVCESRAKVMRQMKRHVRLGAGTSTNKYQEEDGDTPLEGEIQGKGDVMGLWALVSDSILSVHKKLSSKLLLRHVATEQTSERSADAYVDDADIYASGNNENERDYSSNYFTILENADEEEQELTGDPGDDPHDTARQLEKNAQLWASLVELTGGLMAFYKCSIHRHIHN